MSCQDGAAVVTLRYARGRCVFELKVFESIDGCTYLGALTGWCRSATSCSKPTDGSNTVIIPTEFFRSATEAAVIEACQARMLEIESRLPSAEAA
jgi:hypothetical protein